MTNENRPGYKHTPLGWIPEDWEVKKIASVTKLIAGGTPSTHISEYWGGKIPWMNSGELNFKIITEVKGRITNIGLKNSSTKLIPINCVLVGLAGQGKTRGTVAMNKLELCTNQSIAAIFPCNKFESQYLYYNLGNRYEELRRLSTGDGGRGGLNLNLIGSLKVAFPTITEQKAIAKVLSKWDVAIEKHEKLIESYELRKKWLMQQLLTGKKRLPGFKGKWKEYGLGSLGNTYSGLNGKSKNDFGEGKPYIPYLNIFNNQTINISQLDYVKISQNEKQNKAKYGDIFFTVSSETADEVGMASVLLENLNELYLNSFCFGYRLNNFETLHPLFGSYFFRSPIFRKYINQLSQGATRFNLSKVKMMQLSITIPSIEEQTAIAEILQKADGQINIYKKQLNLLKEQKQGLMQVLLTGKKRIKIK